MTAIRYDDDDLYLPAQAERGARRHRKPRPNPHDRQASRAVLTEAVDPIELEGGFVTTYRPSRHEWGWLLQSLEDFYNRGLLSDVLAIIKGGKEANVYRCRAHPDTGLGLVAAKVYRPHSLRQMRNDQVYRQGREILTPNGRPVGKEAERMAHAIQKKTAYGREAAHTSWLMHEFTTLQTLYGSGGAVPYPVAAGPNALLMSYLGDEKLPAPSLHEVAIESDEAGPLFDEVLRNIELMLSHGIVHADLSAYNILYWEGEITLIDFPQVVDAAANRQAYDILERDIARVCGYFARHAPRDAARRGDWRDPRGLTGRLWRRYIGQTPLERDVSEARLYREDEI